METSPPNCPRTQQVNYGMFGPFPSAKNRRSGGKASIFLSRRRENCKQKDYGGKGLQSAQGPNAEKRPTRGFHGHDFR